MEHHPSQPVVDQGSIRYTTGSIAGFRFHHMLRRFSADIGLLDRLAGVIVDRAAATDATEFMLVDLRVPAPILSFSRRRKRADGHPTGTGATIWSVEDLVATHGQDQVARWRGTGQIRRHDQHLRRVMLGDPTFLASAAHEVGHLAVGTRTPKAPAHGKSFVAAFDEASASADQWLQQRQLETAAGTGG